jgi:hypothetical protein
MHNPNSRRVGRGLLAALVAAIVMLGTACQPVPPIGQNMFIPVGWLDSVTGSAGEVRVSGWAAEWNRFIDETWVVPEPTKIMVMVNGNWVLQIFRTDTPRLDVQQVFIDQALWGYVVGRPDADYGFDITVPAPAGQASVCVVALDQWRWLGFPLSAASDDVVLGCRTVTVS